MSCLFATAMSICDQDCYVLCIDVFKCVDQAEKESLHIVNNEEDGKQLSSSEFKYVPSISIQNLGQHVKRFHMTACFS